MNEDDDQIQLLAQLIGRAAVARILGITVKRLYRCMRRLQADPVNPFPKPVLGCGGGARWNLDDIKGWIARGGEHASADAPREPDWARRLDGRAHYLPSQRERRTPS